MKTGQLFEIGSPEYLARILSEINRYEETIRSYEDKIKDLREGASYLNYLYVTEKAKSKGAGK